MFLNIKELKEKVLISEIVGHFIKLKRSGSTETACCPFHSEKSASFTIHKSKNGFKCFGCGKGGDSISFVMEHQRVGFVEAVQIVADIIGFKLEEENKNIVKQHPLRKMEQFAFRSKGEFRTVRVDKIAEPYTGDPGRDHSDDQGPIVSQQEG